MSKTLAENSSSPYKIPADFRQVTDEPYLTPKQKGIKEKVSFENCILIELYKKQGKVWFQMIRESWGKNGVPKNL